MAIVRRSRSGPTSHGRAEISAQAVPSPSWQLTPGQYKFITIGISSGPSPGNDIMSQPPMTNVLDQLPRSQWDIQNDLLWDPSFMQRDIPQLNHCQVPENRWTPAPTACPFQHPSFCCRCTLRASPRTVDPRHLQLRRYVQLSPHYPNVRAVPWPLTNGSTRCRN